MKSGRASAASIARWAEVEVAPITATALAYMASMIRSSQTM